MRTLLIILAICLAGCAQLPPAEGMQGKWKNDCLPQAAAMATSLNEKHVKAKVLLITTTMWKHAIVVYLYPPGENKLWGWDYEWKSIQIRAYFSNPDQCARAWLTATNNGSVLIAADWLE